MAEYLYHLGGWRYLRRPGVDDATHVAWSLDDLPGLAADIHRTVADLLLHGPGGPAIDTAIIDRLRGTATCAGDDTGGLPG